MMLTGIFLQQRKDWDNQGRHELTLVGNNRNLVDILVYQQLRLNHLGSDILAVTRLEEVFDTLCQEQLTIFQIAGITCLEIAVLRKGCLRQFLTVIVARRNRRTFQQNLTLITDLDTDTLNRNTYTTYRIRVA